MTETSPTGRKSGSIRRYILGDFSPDPEGPGSVEKILERLAKARSQLTKESNRLLVLSLVFLGLYFIKVLGLRADLVLFGQKIFEVPYGILVFCIAAQGCSCLATVRLSDARVLDRYLKAVCDKQWPAQADTMYRLIPDESSWLDATGDSIDALDEHSVLISFYALSMLPSLLLALLLFMGPVGAGIYYLIDWKAQIQTGNVALQFYTVLVTTIINFLWLLIYTLLYHADKED